MQPDHKQPSTTTPFSAKPKGEPWVWFTSMGLTVGLVMVVYLLGLILVRGITVFWPKTVVQVTLSDPSTYGIKNSSTLGGEINRIQAKYIPRKIAQEQPPATPTTESLKEWQIFTGNKDVYGFSFKYIPESDILEVNHPADAILIERLEYGDAIGIPISLLTPSGEKIPSDNPAFQQELKKYHKKALERRAKILDIEKRQIGRLNSKLRKIELQKRSYDRLQSLDGTQRAKLAALNDQQKAVEKEFESLNTARTTLRAEQSKGALVLRLFTGEEKSIPLGNFVYYYFPNKSGLLEKTGIFLHSLWAFVSTEPREANTEGGIFPAIFGTFVMTLLLSIVVTPFGVVAAIYLREYATQGLFVRAVRIAVNNLAGVPSIVFGVFGLGFFVYFMGASIDQLFFSAALPTPTFGTGGILWASLTLALMTVPVVIVATEEALAAVPRGMREASLACGASKWQTIQRIVLPASSSGILTGLILAMARGAGEVAPLMLVGVVKLAPALPLDGEFPFFHLDRKFMHLGFHIYDLGFQSPDAEAAVPMVFATTLLLIVLVVVLNLSAILIRENLRRKYSTGAF